MIVKRTLRNASRGIRASWGRISHHLMGAYSRLHEPRAISLIYGLVYSYALGVGILDFFTVPYILRHIEGGEKLILWIATLMVIGAATSLWAIIQGTYWVERYTVAILGLGLFGYLATVIYITMNTPGSRAMRVMAGVLTMVLLGLRYYWITDRPYREDPPLITEHDAE